MTMKEKNDFGSCCKSLLDSMTKPANSLFRVEDNGVLYLAVGYVETEQGVGWFDHAVIYCPFCGKKLQSREDIRKMVK